MLTRLKAALADRTEPPVEALEAEYQDLVVGLDELPDAPAPDDGDDSLLQVVAEAEQPQAQHGGVLALTEPEGPKVYNPDAPPVEEPALVQAQRKRVAPFTRVLKRSSTGKDVKAVQLALRNWYRQHHLGKGPGITGVFGPSTSKALREFQKRRGLKVDGQYGQATHRQLSAHMGPAALKLMIEAKRKTDSSLPKGMRARIVSRALFCYNKSAYSMVYTQGPSRDDWLWQKITVPRTPRYLDCSSFAEWCYWPDCPHPSGWGWRSIGWTGSQINRGKRVSSHAAKPADLIFYPGSHGIGHVTVKISSSLCVSFGSEPMRRTSVWYRTVAFGVNYLGD